MAKHIHTADQKLEPSGKEQLYEAKRVRLENRMRYLHAHQRQLQGKIRHSYQLRMLLGTPVVHFLTVLCGCLTFIMVNKLCSLLYQSERLFDTAVRAEIERLIAGFGGCTIAVILTVVVCEGVNTLSKYGARRLYDRLAASEQVKTGELESVEADLADTIDAYEDHRAAHEPRHVTGDDTRSSR